jgi:hypothetical protein
MRRVWLDAERHADKSLANVAHHELHARPHEGLLVRIVLTGNGAVRQVNDDAAAHLLEAGTTHESGCHVNDNSTTCATRITEFEALYQWHHNHSGTHTS